MYPLAMHDFLPMCSTPLVFFAPKITEPNIHSNSNTLLPTEKVSYNIYFGIMAVVKVSVLFRLLKSYFLMSKYTIKQFYAITT